MTSPEPGRIAIVVVNYHSHELIEANLAGLDRCGDDRPGSAVDVVVVDNLSTEDERAAIAAAGRRHGWRVVESPTNAGFGPGANLGARDAIAHGADVVIFLNPDARADCAAIERLASEVRGDPERLVCPLMVTSSGGPHFRGFQLDVRSGRTFSGWDATGSDPTRQDWLSGACMAMSAEAFDRIGGFSDEYFLYWEDVDISRRALELGLRMAVLDDLTIVHDEGGTQGTRSGRALSPRYYYFNTRNRLVFAARHLDVKGQLRWLALTPQESRMIWLRGGRRQLLHHPEGLAAAVAGSVVGSGVVVRSLARSLTGRGPATSRRG